MNYPSEIAKVGKTQHLLFDIGYSYGLLMNTHRILKELITSSVVVMPHNLAVDVNNLLDDVVDFKAGRLQDIEEIYEVAPELVKKLETEQKQEQ